MDNTLPRVLRRDVLKTIGLGVGLGVMGTTTLSGSVAAATTSQTMSLYSDTNTNVVGRRAGTGQNASGCSLTTFDPPVAAVPSYEVPAWGETKGCFDTNADWIWYSTEEKKVPESDEYYVLNNQFGDVVVFERSFTIDGVPESGSIRIAVDNGYELYVNGTLVGSRAVTDDGLEWECSDLDEPYVGTSGWRIPEDEDCTGLDYDITGELVAGENTLTVRAVNAQDRGDGPIDDGRNPGGLIYQVDIDYVQCSETYPLCAGQDIDVGSVTVTDDGDGTLSITYEVDEPWLLYETHAHVGCSKDDFPLAGSGNPKVGKFDYSKTHEGVRSYTYEVDAPTCGGDIYVATHAVVYEADCGTTAEPFAWASSVVGSDLGTQKDGTAVPDTRAAPENALGAPDDVFLSLGLPDDDGAGYVVVAFDHPVLNGPGDDDILVSEVTNGRGSYPEENADVYVRPAGESDFVYAGTVSNNDDFDGNSPGVGSVAIPDGIVAVDAVKIVDATDPTLFGSRPNGDGYDLDAVGANCLTPRNETAWTCPGAEDVWDFVDRGSWATGFTYKPCEDVVSE